MSQAKKAATKQDSPAADAPAADVPKNESAMDAPAINMLEKAKLISDLAAIWQSDKIKQVISEHPSGGKAYSIFVDAINKEMSSVMTGTSEDFAIIAEKTKDIEQSMSLFHNMIMSFLQSPLVQVLELMAKNLGAKPPMQQHMPMQQQQVQQEYSQHAQPARTVRGGGIGSY